MSAYNYKIKIRIVAVTHNAHRSQSFKLFSNGKFISQIQSIVEAGVYLMMLFFKAVLLDQKLNSQYIKGCLIARSF
ncbi:MAG: hypothetical protein ABS28_04655 [Cryomorphaceae bacterium BACL22 MAG-120619-bin32]|nr:MAG: hypothetical protein ABS28_04655 [Cryomorphaceae bacterium BACL22 MAG-120619-bin32]